MLVLWSVLTSNTWVVAEKPNCHLPAQTERFDPLLAARVLRSVPDAARPTGQNNDDVDFFIFQPNFFTSGPLAGRINVLSVATHNTSFATVAIQVFCCALFGYIFLAETLSCALISPLDSRWCCLNVQL